MLLCSGLLLLFPKVMKFKEYSYMRASISFYNMYRIYIFRCLCLNFISYWFIISTLSYFSVLYPKLNFPHISLGKFLIYTTIICSLYTALLIIFVIVLPHLYFCLVIHTFRQGQAKKNPKLIKYCE